jgi:hypothetical protein
MTARRAVSQPKGSYVVSYSFRKSDLTADVRGTGCFPDAEINGNTIGRNRLTSFINPYLDGDIGDFLTDGRRTNGSSRRPISVPLSKAAQRRRKMK